MYEREPLEQITRRAEDELRVAGTELTAAGLVTSLADVPAAVAALEAGDWDLLMLNVINWIDVRSAVEVALEFRERSVLLYSYGGRTEHGLLVSPAAGAGSTGLRYPLERFGVRFTYLYNAPDAPMDVAGVLHAADVARAARRLRHTRLGMTGAHDMGLMTTPFDTTRLRGRIGPEIESVDLLVLERHAAAVDDARLKAECARLKAGWMSRWARLTRAR